MATVNGISNAEGALNADMAAAGSDELAQKAATDSFLLKIKDLMDGVKPESLIIIGIWIAVLLIGCFVAVFLLLKFGYKLDEKRHREIVEELEQRHAAVGFNAEEVEQPQEEQAEQLE